jgi:formylglycine-generating enzyme required for sulfatase activity
MDGTNPLSGINQRTLTLSNGEVIWDMAGNVAEWTDATLAGKDQPAGARPPTRSWYEYPNLLTYGTISPERLLPSNPTWNSSQGYGKFVSYGDTSDISYGFIRSGYYGEGVNGGILMLSLFHTPDYTAVGFRCAR